MGRLDRTLQAWEETCSQERTSKVEEGLNLLTGWARPTHNNLLFNEFKGDWVGILITSAKFLHRSTYISVWLNTWEKVGGGGVQLPSHVLQHTRPPRPSVHFSHSVVSNSLRPPQSQHARPPCPSPTPGVHTNPCPSSQWCHPAISSSVVPFSSCPQSLPAPGSFPMSQLFAWGGQSIGVSASVSVLPMNTQDWSSGWIGWIALQSKGLSRVFSNTTAHKRQFFGAQLSL